MNVNILLFVTIYVALYVITRGTIRVIFKK